METYFRIHISPFCLQAIFNAVANYFVVECYMQR